MSTRIAIYARVSTTNHGQDLGLQTRELRQFAEARGWTVAGEYIDAGVSGAKDSRPELNRLMADAHKPRFDAVCVWRFDSSRVPSRTCCVRSKLSKPWESTSFPTRNRWIPRRLRERWFSLCWALLPN
jgi:hypothetical protein